MNSRKSKTRPQKEQPEFTCPLCGSAEITTSWNPFTFNYGSGKSMAELTVNVPARRCEACEFEYLDEEAEHLEHEAVCRHLGVLPPAEIRRIRKECNMTRARFAEVTRLGEASLNRWENGLNIQTHAYDLYLRLLTRPGNMLALEKLAHSDTPPRTEILAEHRFRVLEVNENVQKEQESFRLHKAA